MEVIYLDEGIDSMRNCLKCKKEIPFLPTYVHIAKSTVTVKKWECSSCEIEYFQTYNKLKK